MASEHGCPIEMHRIQIEKCDEMYDEGCDGQTFMPFHRASYDPNTGQSPNNPREQVSSITWHINKLVNSNVGWETSYPVSVALTPATLPSKHAAQAAAEHKQEMKFLNLNFS